MRLGTYVTIVVVGEYSDQSAEAAVVSEAERDFLLCLAEQQGISLVGWCPSEHWHEPSHVHDRDMKTISECVDIGNLYHLDRWKKQPVRDNLIRAHVGVVNSLITQWESRDGCRQRMAAELGELWRIANP